jgi:hypothetical protein
MTDDADYRGPVFLVGAQRSGTTALARCLSASAADGRGMFTVDGKLLYYLRRWWTDPTGDRHARADEISHSLRRRRPTGVGIDDWLARADSALHASATRIATCGVGTGVWQEIRAVCASAYGRGVWGDKYNEYLLDLPFIHRAFPDATWVFTVRDPRQVVASMISWRQVPCWNPCSVDACAYKWIAWNERWLQFRDSISPTRRVETEFTTAAGTISAQLVSLFGPTLPKRLCDYSPMRARCSVGVQVPRKALDLWNRLRSVQHRTDGHGG